ncbi:hypothetical protein BGZ60DRAFT_434707 [Tricladium varicosporioides]|nr:hypothetical protein BGZ60DRAFT_434707 [Hymenoscyphus varicosporioides]
MESPGSELSMGNTASSVADPTPADTSPAQTSHNVSKLSSPTQVDAPMIVEADSDSDVSMSAETDEEDASENSEEPSPSTVQLHSGLNGTARSNSSPVRTPRVEGSRKRKHPDVAEPIPNGQDEGILREIRKRVKFDGPLPKWRTFDGHLQQDKSLLPAEIWHHIFIFCPPRMLGLLLQVNKSFNAQLDISSPYHYTLPSSTALLQSLQPDAIWRASRLLFNQGIPGPLADKSEIDMWRLACGSQCQFCTRKQSEMLAVMDQWNPGPGENGVRPVWSFGIRTCGACLEERSVKEIDLLLSSSIPSPLMAALPFIFLSSELHVIPTMTLQNGQQPSTIQITKRFLEVQVKQIKDEFEIVKALGKPTTEEWLKGLELRGKERKTDAGRWERYEVTKGVEMMRTSRLLDGGSAVNGFKPASTTTVVNEPPVKKEPVVKMESPPANGVKPVSQYQPQNTTQQARHFPLYPPPPGVPASRLPQPVFSTFPPNLPQRFDSPTQSGFTAYPPPPPRAFPPAKHERTKEEVAQLKAARRAEIERRSILLDPPLTAGVLAHMASFQAAIQIIQPLTDSAWEVLKPRLLSQREEAEQRENDRLAQTRVVQERFDDRKCQDVQIKPEAKDLADREWDDIQAPLRARISGYADEIIRDGWNGGDKVNYDNCPKFAADVLIYVRKRFYAEVAKDEAAVRATGQEPEMDPPNGPYLRKLILENMKWVFDTKVKPHTEQHRKELFLCNACESNPKYYGFEGVVQHYAAKHTSALSVGSVVVHWKSEWPEYPPFNPDPTAVASSSYYSTAPSASTPYPTSGPPLQPNYGYGGYHPVPVSGAMQAPNSHGYQESPGPYYGHPQYSDQYARQQGGPYVPPQPYQDTTQAYQPSQYSAPPPPSSIGYQETVQNYPQPGFGGTYPPSSQGMYNVLNQGPQYLPTPSIPPREPYNSQANQYQNSYSQPAPYPTNGYATAPAPVIPAAVPKTEEYKAQLQDIARSSRDIWNSINPMKDIPGSVKVYTIIYHLLKRSRENFQDDPPLSMIIDGLSNNKEMRPVRNINGLLCKACTLGMAGSRSDPSKKHFSFPQLLNHFHSIHETGASQNESAYILDWKKDMVELPESSKLRSLTAGPEKDDQRLGLIIEAIPDALPPAVLEFENDSIRPSYDAVDAGLYANLAPSQDNHEKYYTSGGISNPPEPNNSVDNEEYDPRNPRDLPMDTRPQYRAAPRDEQSRDKNTRESQPLYRFARPEDDRREATYQDRPDRAYVEYRPTSPLPQGKPVGGYERVIIQEEAPRCAEREIRYWDPEKADYRVRRDPEKRYEISRDYRLQNEDGYGANRHPAPATQEPPYSEERLRPVDDVSAPQNRLFEVVAQISHQAQQARARLAPQEEPAEAGSEDGEVRARPRPKQQPYPSRPMDEASAAAERFLNNFLPGETSVETAYKVDRRQPENRWEERGDNEPRRIPADDPNYRVRDEHDNGGTHRIVRTVDGVVAAPNGYVVLDRSSPGHSRAHPYEHRYGSTIPEHAVPREKSPELVDRRYKLNDVVYRDERQNSHGTYRTPSRYARYESVRLENDRARSRSPVYVKMGPTQGQYRERSPTAHPLQQEPIYRNRSPQPVIDEAVYDRAPRPEYRRVYADEPRREPQYAEAYELVRVSDSQGEYYIRRPVRRDPGPVYATYGDDGYGRQPIYESRAPVSRPDAAPSYDEYDPRHPEPPLPTSVHQASRYQ